MGPLTAFNPGEIILVRFPFSDLSEVKLRPAVVLAEAGRGEWVLCQISSKQRTGIPVVLLTETSFAMGSLRLTSYARPTKLFTAHRNLIVVKLATLKLDVFIQIIDVAINVLRKSLTP